MALRNDYSLEVASLWAFVGISESGWLRKVPKAYIFSHTMSPKCPFGKVDGRSVGLKVVCTERVCIMNVRVVCFPASSSCISTEPAASVTENVESRKCELRPVVVATASLQVLHMPPLPTAHSKSLQEADNSGEQDLWLEEREVKFAASCTM